MSCALETRDLTVTVCFSFHGRARSCCCQSASTLATQLLLYQ